MADIKTLPEDIYSLFNPDIDHIVSEDNLEEFCQALKETIRIRLKRPSEKSSPLRFSALGKKDRQIWYEARPVEGGKEEMPLKNYVKFLYGDILEQLLVLLTKEAGHTVERTQEEVDVDGVKGHIDAIVDGVVVDFKSASPIGYKKFEQKSVVQDDSFGYVEQLSGYSNVLTPEEDAAWIAIDKVGGDICVSPLPYSVIRHHKPEDRIAELKKIIDLEEPPQRCYEDVEDGKSGNRKLSTPCSYCAHKKRCWPEVRTFLYSNGPRFLTVVSRVPDVPEVT